MVGLNIVAFLHTAADKDKKPCLQFSPSPQSLECKRQGRYAITDSSHPSPSKKTLRALVVNTSTIRKLVPHEIENLSLNKSTIPCILGLMS